MAQAGSTTLILGGGIGGLVTANRLRRRLGRQHRVVLVDREMRHTFAPSFLWVMTGQRRPEKISKELERIHKRGVEFVNDTIKAIDPEKRQVQLGNTTLLCDHLVVSLGADLAPEAVPGLSAFGFNVYTLDGAVRAREALHAFDGGTVGVVIAGTPYKCPAAPYEAAMLMEDLLRRRGVRGRSEVHMFAPEQQPLPSAGPAIGSAVSLLLERRGIHYHPGFKLAEVHPETQELAFDNGERVKLDLLLYIPPHRPAAVVAQSALAGTNGWVSKVNPRTLETPFASVFSIGDINLIPLASGLPLPKAGVFAHHQAEAVSQTIASRVSARGVPGEFDGGGG